MTMLRDFDALKVNLDHVKTSVQRRSSMFVFSIDEVWRNKSSIKAFIQGEERSSVLKISQLAIYSITILIADKNKMIDDVQPMNIPRRW